MVPPGPTPAPSQGPRRRPLRRAPDRRRPGPHRWAVAGPLQPGVPPGVRRVAAPVPAHPTARTGRCPAAQHRPIGDRDLLRRRPHQRRVVHHQLPPGPRHVPLGLPGIVPTGPPAHPDPGVCGAGLRPPAEPHVSRSRGPGRSVAWSVSTPPDHEEPRMITIANAQFWVHDQDEATRLLHPHPRLGGAIRRDDGRVGLPLGGRRPGRPGRHRPRPHARSGATDGRRRHERSSWPNWSPRAWAAPCSSRPTTARRPTTSSPSAAWCSTIRRPPQPYGIDTSFRDPSGNNVRLTQVLEFSLDRG